MIKRNQIYSVIGIVIMLLIVVSSQNIFAQDSKEKLVPINIELPKAMFVGTPTNMAIEKLEKPLANRELHFLLPKELRIWH